MAEQQAVVHARRATILPELSTPCGSNARLPARRRAPAVRRTSRVKLGAHQAIAVLAGMGALVRAHHGERLLGDRAHRLDVLLLLQVEDRPHVQAADRSVRVPGAARAVPLEQLGETRGVVGQMLERDRAVLDERHRLAGAPHRRGDVEPGLAHLQILAWAAGSIASTTAPAKPRSAISSPRCCSCAPLRSDRRRRTRPAGEPPARRARSARSEADTPDLTAPRIVRSTSSTAEGPARRSPWSRPWPGRRSGNGRPDHPVPRQRLQLQQQAAEQGERAFGADQKLGHVVAGRVDAIEIVAADPALDLGNPAATAAASRSAIARTVWISSR